MDIKRWMLIIIILVAAAFTILLFDGRGGEESSNVATSSTTTSEDVKEGPERTVIGQSVDGRNIEAVTFGDGDTHVLLVGAIHGGYEWNTVLLSRAFIDYFTAYPDELPDTITLTIIPMLNPDGVHEVLGTTGPFAAEDAPPTAQTTDGRFNANGVDLNRNFDCNWQPTSTWRGQTVDAGESAFSEPEAQVMRDYTQTHEPDAAIFFHSAADGVYGSQCNDGILTQTRDIMNAYADASGYPAIESFDHYEITGDVEGWHAKLGIPSISVELTSHETLEWNRNLAGVNAILDYYAQQD